MAEQILTSVSAEVEPAREEELTRGFRELTEAPWPAGLLRTELMRGQNGTWCIQSLWRDRDTLMTLRASGVRPAALELFDRLGAGLSHEVFTVQVSHPRTEP